MGKIGGNRRRFVIGLCRAAVAISVIPVSSHASAQTARTLRMIVPVPPGGAGDIVARDMAEQVGRMAGVSVVIENRPGAGTIIGTESVARSSPDGNTLLLTAPYLLIGSQLRKVNYDPLTSFEPICHLVSSPGVFAVNSGSPYRTLGDLIDDARARPRALTLASVG